MQRFGKVLIFIVALVLVFMGSPGIAGKPAAPSTLNILTINLMQYTAIEHWSSRADNLVSFVRNQEDSGKPVDIILCQEGHSGLASLILNGTENTINDLQRRLSDQGLSYQVKSIISFDDPNFPQFSKYLVGVLSKYPIVATAQGDVWCNGGKRAVIACLLKIRGLGKIASYSVHLDPNPDCAGSEDQGMQLTDLVDSLNAPWSPVATILGGDFNSEDTEDPNGLYIYLTDPEGQNFTDTFAEANGADGFTFNVPGNPFASGTPKRIDYIFARGEGGTLGEEFSSEVVLNGVEGAFMSDHCGVLSRIEVTAPPKGGKPYPR